MPGPLFLVIALAAAAPHPATGQLAGGSELVTAVQDCQKIGDNSQRLACYDRNVSALATARAHGDVSIVDRNQIRQVRRSLFGFSGVHIPFFGNSRDRDTQDEPRELNSALASFRDIGNGFFRFSITEPQSTWETTEGSSFSDGRSGDKVTIQKGALGSYFVQIAGDKWVRARRIR